MHQTTTVKDEDDEQQQKESNPESTGPMRSSATGGGNGTNTDANDTIAPAAAAASGDVKPSVGNCCAGCRGPIRDKFIFSVIDLHWHQDCVQCVDCSLKLNERCYTYDGKLYCKLDYFRRFGPKCFACREPIGRSDLVQKIKGNRVYHLKCFTCNDCHKQLKTGEQMHLIDGKRLLCNRDYHQQLSIGGGGNNIKSGHKNWFGGNGGSGGGDSQQQHTYYTLMSNQQQQQQQQLDKQPPIIKLELDKLDNKQQQQLDNNNSRGAGDDDEGGDELDEDQFEEGEEEDDEDDEDELDDDDSLMAGSHLSEMGRLLGYNDNTTHSDNNNLENEENHSLGAFVELGAGQPSGAGKLKKGPPKQLSNNQHTKQHSHQQQLNGSAKRKRRRKQKGLSSAAVAGSGRVRALGASGGKKLANRNGESILNGMPPQSTGTGSILASVHHSSLGSTMQSAVTDATNLQQQQQHANSNPIKSVSSSAASTASNSSTSSSLASLAHGGPGSHHHHHHHHQQQQSNSQQHQSQHHHHHHHHQQQQHHQQQNHHQHHGQQGSTQSTGHKPTRVRTVLNEKQLQTLRDCYAHNPRPDALMKEQLVDLTGLSPRVIRVWFQNKRCKDKKKSILYKQMQQHEKDGRHLAGLTLMRGVPMIASSPIQYDDHSTVSSTPGAPQQQQPQHQQPHPPTPGSMAELHPAAGGGAPGDRLGSPLSEAQQQQHRSHYAGPVHSPAAVDIHAYQPPWNKLMEYVHHPHAQQQQAAGGAPPSDRVNPASPRYQQLMGQIHGFNSAELQVVQSSSSSASSGQMVDPQSQEHASMQATPELQRLAAPFGNGPGQSQPPANTGYPPPAAAAGPTEQEPRMSRAHLGLNQPAPPAGSVQQQQQPLSHLHQFQH